ncbi:MAG: hypothetical protein K1X70_11095 [Leptospirales bacterium]|nr:hypothetical protein [Leptospirales bacterium]
MRILNIRNGTTFALLALVTTTWYFAAGLLSPSWRDDSLGGNDWDLNFFYTESSALPVRDFAQIPFWNPFYKGGMPLFENPQARTFTPAVFLAPVMGPVRALKFSVFIYFLLGAAGSFYLFRFALSIRSLALVIPVVMVPFCGYVPQHVFAGHANFVSILMLPWCLGAMILFQNTGRFRHVAVFSLSAATMVWDGHIYGFLQLLVFVTIVFSTMAVVQKKPEIFLNAFILLVAACALSAVRLLPEIVYFLKYGAYFRPDHVSLTLSNVLHTFVASSQDPLLARNWENQEHAWWEYGNYIGLLPFLLLLCALPFLRKSEVPWLVALVLFILLMMGDFHVLSPAHLLSQIPGFSNMRCSGRWGFPVVISLAVLLSICLHRALEKASEYTGMGAIASVLVICFSLYFCYDIRKNRKPISQTFVSGKSASSLVSRIERSLITVPSLPTYGANSAQFAGILNFFSVRDGYDMLNSNTSMPAKGEAFYRGEYYLEHGSEVKPQLWTPNRIDFEIESEKGDQLVINQNYYSDWRATDGFEAKSHNGIISVLLHAGKNRFSIYYLSTAAVVGFLLGMAMFVGVYFFCEFRTRRFIPEQNPA